MNANDKKKGINMDEWMTLYDLIDATNGDMNNWVDDGMWPSILDEFSEFRSKK